MRDLIVSLLGGALPWVVGGLGLLVTAVLTALGLKRAGRKEERLEAELEGRRTRDDVEEDHAGDPPDVRRNRVREWER